MTLLFLFLYFCGFLEIEKMLLARFANSRFIAYSTVVVAATQLRLQQEIHIQTRSHTCVHMCMCVCVHLYLFFARKHFRHFKCSERSDRTG